MNQQPWQTPPRWWSPRLSPRWMKFWRCYRKQMALRQHALTDVRVEGGHHLQQTAATEGGVLVTPNHPSHADPFVMVDAGDQLGVPMYFMAAWQVFHNTHRLGRRVLRQHGVFSVNREGNDVTAVKEAIRIMETEDTPLVIFPEGEVFHLNDRVTPFRRGAVHSAVLAAERSQKPVSIVPCGIRFLFTEDPTAEMHRRLDRLERFFHGSTCLETNIEDRVFSFLEQLICRWECEFLGRVGRGDLQCRVDQLIESLLAPMERQFCLTVDRHTIPERVKRLRQQVIGRLEATKPVIGHNEDRVGLQHCLHKLFVATQAYSYPIDYVSDDPSLERVAETIEKLEEDVLQLQRSAPMGKKQAVVTFDTPVVIRPETSRLESIEIQTRALEERVQLVLDRTSPLQPTAPVQLPDTAIPPEVAA